MTGLVFEPRLIAFFLFSLDSFACLLQQGFFFRKERMLRNNACDVALLRKQRDRFQPKLRQEGINKDTRDKQTRKDSDNARGRERRVV